MNLLKTIDKIFGADGYKNEEGRKRVFLSFGIILCIPFVAFFVINDLRNQRVPEGLFVLFFLAVIVLNLIALKYVKNMKILFRFTGASVLSLLGYEVAVGGGQGSAFLWFYFFPSAAFYLAGKREGTFWVSISLVISGFFFLNPIFYEYERGTVIRFLLTYSIVSLLSLALEYSRSRYYLELMREKKELEDALKEVNTLQGLLPICSYCKKIRDDKGYWNQLENYLDKHSQAQFSHSICPECSEKYYSKYFRKKSDSS